MLGEFNEGNPLAVTASALRASLERSKLAGVSSSVVADSLRVPACLEAMMESLVKLMIACGITLPLGKQPAGVEELFRGSGMPTFTAFWSMGVLAAADARDALAEVERALSQTPDFLDAHSEIRMLRVLTLSYCLRDRPAPLPTAPQLRNDLRASIREVLRAAEEPTLLDLALLCRASAKASDRLLCIECVTRLLESTNRGSPPVPLATKRMARKHAAQSCVELQLIDLAGDVIALMADDAPDDTGILEWAEQHGIKPRKK